MIAPVIFVVIASPATPLPPAAPASDGPTVEVSGEVRLRAETRDETDLDEDVNRIDFDGQRYLLRSRLRAVAEPSERITVTLELQDSRRFGAEPTTAASISNVDLHQGHVWVHDLAGQPVSLQFGRTELSYGDQRLIGAFGWDNVGRAFDAVRARVEPTPCVTIDGFWARLHDNRRVERALGDDFYGIYGTWRYDPVTVDGYGLYLYDRGRLVDTDGDGNGDTERFPGGGRLHLATLGSRVDATPLAGLHVNAEGALQVGERGDLSVLAFAVQANADYTIAAPGKPKIIVGGAYSPGDDDPGDDDWQTFENLFPTNHLFYGYLDLAAWKNIVDVYGGVGAAPHERAAVTATVHALRRASDDDTFYVASGAPLVPRDAAAATGASYVGTEIDLLATWKMSPGFGLLGGVSYLLAGSFLDAAFDDAPDPLFAYLQATGSF